MFLEDIANLSFKDTYSKSTACKHSLRLCTHNTLCTFDLSSVSSVPHCYVIKIKKRLSISSISHVLLLLSLARCLPLSSTERQTVSYEQHAASLILLAASIMKRLHSAWLELRPFELTPSFPCWTICTRVKWPWQQLFCFRFVIFSLR